MESCLGSVLDSSCHIGMPVPLSQMGFPKLSSSGSQLGTKRRQSNGEVDGNETKPKRGRPRKMKKEDRYDITRFYSITEGEN